MESLDAAKKGNEENRQDQKKDEVSLPGNGRGEKGTKREGRIFLGDRSGGVH